MATVLGDCVEERHETDADVPAPRVLPAEVHNVGRVIRETRIALGMSAKELGKAVALSEPHICQIERGAVPARFVKLLDILRYLHIRLGHPFVREAEGLAQAIIEEVLLLDEGDLQVLAPMVHGLATARLQRRAHESRNQEHCA